MQACLIINTEDLVAPDALVDDYRKLFGSDGIRRENAPAHRIPEDVLKSLAFDEDGGCS